MVNKLKTRDDHRVLPDFLLDQEMVYRTGQNIDINRNAVTFQNVPDMIAFVGLLEDVFDGVARTKNMFSFPFERAEMQLHYRTLMMVLSSPFCFSLSLLPILYIVIVSFVFYLIYFALFLVFSLLSARMYFFQNMVWPPPKGNFARTFRELAAKSRPLWDRYENEVQPDTTFPKEHYQDRIKIARAHLEALAATNTPLHFIVESQVLLQKYLEGRIAMHLLYVIHCKCYFILLHRDAPFEPRNTLCTAWNFLGNSIG
jgi:hypothetical protein